jgi:hypothetical protein
VSVLQRNHHAPDNCRAMKLWLRVASALWSLVLDVDITVPGHRGRLLLWDQMLAVLLAEYRLAAGNVVIPTVIGGVAQPARGVLGIGVDLRDLIAQGTGPGQVGDHPGLTDEAYSERGMWSRAGSMVRPRVPLILQTVKPGGQGAGTCSMRSSGEFPAIAVERYPTRWRTGLGCQRD